MREYKIEKLTETAYAVRRYVPGELDRSFMCIIDRHDGLAFADAENTCRALASAEKFMSFGNIGKYETRGV